MRRAHILRGSVSAERRSPCAKRSSKHDRSNCLVTAKKSRPDNLGQTSLPGRGAEKSGLIQPNPSKSDKIRLFKQARRSAPERCLRFATVSPGVSDRSPWESELGAGKSGYIRVYPPIENKCGRPTGRTGGLDFRGPMGKSQASLVAGGLFRRTGRHGSTAGRMPATTSPGSCKIPGENDCMT